MRLIPSWLKAAISRQKGPLGSIAAHLCLLFLLVCGMGRSAKVVPYRLPGTAQGVSLLTYYSPGSIKPAVSRAPKRTPEQTRPAPLLRSVATSEKPDKTKKDEAQAGSGTSAQSGLGEGDITIALQSYFPYPTPNLSS
jgi:hypothetical protein